MNATVEKKATAITPLQEFRNTLTAMQPQFVRALPKSVDPDKFQRVCETAIATKPEMLQADRQSLIAACTKAAQDGLFPDGREGALVEFNSKNANGSYSKKVQWMPMVQGLVKLARNSGEVSTIAAEVVYKNDKFTYRIGLDDMPLHEPDWFGADRGEPIGAWAVVVLKNGEKICRILPKAKIMRIASKTKNAAQYDEKTGAYYDEWWRKAAIKNVLKYAPRSTELDRIIQRENEEYNLETSSDPDYESNLVDMNAGSSMEEDAPKAAAKPRTRTAAPKEAAQAAGKGSSRLNAIKAANKAPAAEEEAQDQGYIEAEYTDETEGNPDDDRI